ncbi:MAG: fasciclin domain-containing protein [Bacteroidales bacterium]|nr:fasciclin domain-containing protein [Bacteroidales bacterium]MDT8430782.1 fasciclin domain-containing protein [Bacteroidales bacterium]
MGEEKLKYLFQNPKELIKILRYHFASGEIYAKDLSDGQILEMSEGTDAFISLYEGKAFINQAKIIKTDIRTYTGVIHFIDAVITQPTSIVDIVVNSPRHETLEAAVIAAELAGALSADGTFTLFAPTDDAFAALGQATIDALLADPTGQLAEILKYQVVGATALSSSLSDGDTFTTLEGSDITVTISNGDVFINDAKVVFADYEAPNGVVHVIDAVIQPEATNIKEEISIFSNAVVYPNPASDLINFRFEMSNSSEVSIEVYDIVGQKVTERYLGVLPTGGHDYVMGTESMENGIYIIIVNSGNSAFVDKVKVVR